MMAGVIISKAKTDQENNILMQKCEVRDMLLVAVVAEKYFNPTTSSLGGRDP